MSLKVFHIIFIASSVVLILGYGIWLLQSYMSTNEIVYILGAIVSFVVGVGLIVYGIAFLRKFRHV